MDRHQFNGSHSQITQVLNDGWVGKARVGATEFFRNIRVGHRHALDVGFVNDCFVVRNTRCTIVAPVEEWVHHDRLHCVINAVFGIATVGVIWIGDVVRK